MLDKVVSDVAMGFSHSQVMGVVRPASHWAATGDEQDH